MSSIIVLDSSDEDESPPKKPHLKASSDLSSLPHGSIKNHTTKQRIPSGITVTQRQAPTAVPISIAPVNAAHPPKTPASLGGTRVNHAITNFINDERQTPTPPKNHGGGLAAPLQRKRKTPTPPQAMPRLAPKPFASMMSSPAVAATTMSPLPAIMPMITGVHSMAAGATPPLQLMATPPHNLGAFTGLNEQMLMNSHMFHTNLPPNTTITAHTNPNQNNLNNNFKIHLPPKTASTPSPAASPASSSAPKTPSPQLMASQGSRTEKSSKRAKLTTVLKSSDDAWVQQRQKHQSKIDKHRDDVIELTMESPKSSSSRQQQTPLTSPSTPKSQKSPPSDILDLTDSPDRNVINLTDTPRSIKDVSRDKQTNGGDTPPIKSSVNTNGKDIRSPEANKDTEAKPKLPSKQPLEPEFAELIKVCREADKSDDMAKLIKSKLVKYYYEVHEDFVKSKSFRKSIRKVVEAIRAEPDLVYYNLKTIVEELKIRRKAKIVEVPTPLTPTIKTEEIAPTTTTATDDSNSSPTEVASTSASAANPNAATSSASTGNKKLDEQIKKLNKALYVLTKRIEVLEETAVDWDDDDSSFLQVERFKKRACQIYEKICDLTGESKNARRLVKKPIKFNETRIPQFNKTLQAFINRTKEFPDYFDVLRMLEHCNRTYSLGLVNFEMRNIAQDAFIKVGKLLQSRRKAELYETVTHYGGNVKDPAQSDPVLAAKLSENQKNHKKISDILEKYARRQDMPEEEEDENKSEKKEKEVVKDTSMTADIVVSTAEGPVAAVIAGVVADACEETESVVGAKKDLEQDTSPKEASLMVPDESEEEDDDDEEEDDDELNLEEQVETLANGEISDNESDTETRAENSKDAIADKTELGADVVLASEKVSIDDCLDVSEIHDEIFQTANEKDLRESNKSYDAKTVINPAVRDCLNPPNGKIKESIKVVDICNNSTSPLNALVDPPATTTTTTTTAIADLKIVPVSSLNTENSLRSPKNSECNTKITSQSAGVVKSLEEIVISDEES
ncbi:daxx-like protein [Stomoxys calcitrans]|uniref:daxx-like protein n=1 Tax=Stomoxys calcitrans TaxID=35570 RepID=UPI0027E3699A|nr:daxx-like protein [Stomoxys calcitrans]